MKKQRTELFFSYEGFSISLIWIGILLIIIIFGAALLDTFVFNWVSMSQNNKIGNIGQLLEGTVGSIWALAGVVLYYEALRFQRLELKSQRHEFELNRQEVIEQTQQLRAQNQTLWMMTFENTFFQLVFLHNEIVSSITYETFDIVENREKVIAGRQCFFNYYNEFRSIFNNNVDMMGAVFPDKEEVQAILNESYMTFYNRHQEALGHYLRNIQTIIKFIDASEVKNKWFYTNLFHDHLSNYELIMLLYHCISEIGLKLKPLVEKYSLLENIPVDEIMDIRHKDFLGTAAYVATK
jgi:hypothetical protein